MRTPWGQSDYEKAYGPGVTFYGTPGHGGFRVLESARRQWPMPLQQVETFAPRGWYEEDCDAAIVICAMPDRFEMQAVVGCTAQLLHRANGTGFVYDKPDPLLQAFFASDAGKTLVAKCEEWKAAHAEHYQQSGGGSAPGGGWRQLWMPYSDDLPELVTIHPNVPMDAPAIATKAELEALGYDVRMRSRLIEKEAARAGS